MNFSSLFRNIFGIPDGNPHESSIDRNDDSIPRGNDFRNPIWNSDDKDDDDDDFRNAPRNNFSFQIFTNPLEMHRFFEHQMGEILKSFQSQMFELPPNFGGTEYPALENPDRTYALDEGAQASLRDKYLKPDKTSPVQPRHWFSRDRITDTDLDERIKSSELDSFFNGHPIEPSMVPMPEKGYQTKSFGNSVVIQTTRRPDGTMEHHRTARDSQGNAETTVTRQVGDQSYTVTTKMSPTGVEERTENLVNIDPGNLSEFENKWKGGSTAESSQHSSVRLPPNWFPFDKFFPKK